MYSSRNVESRGSGLDTGNEHLELRNYMDNRKLSNTPVYSIWNESRNCGDLVRIQERTGEYRKLRKSGQTRKLRGSPSSSCPSSPYCIPSGPVKQESCTLRAVTRTVDRWLLSLSFSNTLLFLGLTRDKAWWRGRSSSRDREYTDRGETGGGRSGLYYRWSIGVHDSRGCRDWGEKQVRTIGSPLSMLHRGPWLVRE